VGAASLVIFKGAGVDFYGPQTPVLDLNRLLLLAVPFLRSPLYSELRGETGGAPLKQERAPGWPTLCGVCKAWAALLRHLNNCSAD